MGSEAGRAAEPGDRVGAQRFDRDQDDRAARRIGGEPTARTRLAAGAAAEAEQQEPDRRAQCLARARVELSVGVAQNHDALEVDARLLGCQVLEEQVELALVADQAPLTL